MRASLPLAAALGLAAVTLWVTAVAPPGPGGKRMRLHQACRVAGKPLLGTYGADTVESIQAVHEVGMNVVVGGREHLNPATEVGRACETHGIRVLYHLTQHVYGKPRLLDRVTPDQSEIPLFTYGAGPVPSAGVIQLDDELIRYERAEANQLLACTRGYGGTVRAEHRGGTILFWPDECAREVEAVRCSDRLWGYYVLDDSPGDALSALRAMYRLLKRLDPDRIVAAGYGSAGSLCNFGPGVCDLMLIYWYPVFGSGKYLRLMTSHQVQWMLAAAREQVPGVPFAGVYQTFDAALGNPQNAGKGIPTAEQLREQLEDYVREGACGLVAFLCAAQPYSGWAGVPHLRRVVQEAHEEIRRTGGLLVRPEPPEMRAQRVQPTGYWRRPRRFPGIPPAWWVVLPFGPAGDRGVDAVFGPEERVQLDAVYEGRYGPVRWVVRRSFGGVVGLGELLGAQELARDAVAYACCEVHSPSAQEARLLYGSDDDLMVWLNGEQVVRRVYAGGLERDAKSEAVQLRRGWNRLLVKVHNRSGMWGFHLRLADCGGSPVTGLRFRPMPR